MAAKSKLAWSTQPESYNKILSHKREQIYTNEEELHLIFMHFILYLWISGLIFSSKIYKLSLALV